MTSAALPAFRGTLGAPFACEGKGLHTGRMSALRATPAAPGRGVVFRRFVDGAAHDVPALWTNRRSRPLCTALQTGKGPLARTVEHLLAALLAFGIDDVLIELDGEEVPIFDGSARPWVELIAAAGRREHGPRRRYLRVLTRVAYRLGGAKLRIDPAPEFSISAGITLSHFGQLRWDGRIDPATFARELAPSRSFGRFRWAFAAKMAGLFHREPVLRGATFANTAALWGKGAIGGLRMPDEPVRHRALDLVGDLALAGMPILGRVTASRPGHEHNYALLAALMLDRAAWDVVEIDEVGALRNVAD